MVEMSSNLNQQPGLNIRENRAMVIITKMTPLVAFYSNTIQEVLYAPNDKLPTVGVTHLNQVP